MCELDQIKSTTLQKLDEYVIGELKYLTDADQVLDSFSLGNMIPDYLSKEEKIKYQIV